MIYYLYSTNSTGFIIIPSMYRLINLLFNQHFSTISVSWIILDARNTSMSFASSGLQSNTGQSKHHEWRVDMASANCWDENKASNRSDGENKERQKHSRSQQNYKVLSGGFTTPWSHSWLFLEPDRQASQCLETYDYNCLHPMLVEWSRGWSDRLKDTTLLQALQTTSDLKLQRPCLRHQLRPWHKSLP